MKINKKTYKMLCGVDFSAPIEKSLLELSHLILRVGFSSLMITHGWAKLSDYQDKVGGFPDPIGWGSKISLSLTIGTEFFAALLLALGLFTRLSALSLVVTMSIIVFIFHGNDPFQRKELAILYGLAFLVLFISGGKKWSLDHILRAKFF